MYRTMIKSKCPKQTQAVFLWNLYSKIQIKLHIIVLTRSLCWWLLTSNLVRSQYWRTYAGWGGTWTIITPSTLSSGASGRDQHSLYNSSLTHINTSTMHIIIKVTPYIYSHQRDKNGCVQWVVETKTDKTSLAGRSLSIIQGTRIAHNNIMGLAS